MYPPSTMSFEPGLERGMPWGRDLFTFVTSAAGHMMRTLQRPRKNKPSKRQVNHRRFLHNMIQRKFAEIEAANQQLASALFSVETSQSQSELKSSHKNEIKNNSATMTSCETETPAKQQHEANERKTLKSLVVNPDINHPNSREVNQPWGTVEEFAPRRESSPQPTADFSFEREQITSTPPHLDNLSQVANIILEDSVFTWLESMERIRQGSDVHSPKSDDVEQQYLGITLFDMIPASPAVSPLSLDSCDFEGQMQPDSDRSTEEQHIVESLQMNVLENPELLDASQEYLQSQNGDERMASVWHIQKEEEQSCFQNNLTFPNTPLEGYIMDDLTDCAGGVITEGLEVRPQATMLLDSSLGDIDTEYDSRGSVACMTSPYRYGCHQNGTRFTPRHTGFTKESHLNKSEIGMTTTLSKEDDYAANCSWSISEKSFGGLELSDISNPSLDHHVLQRLDQTDPNQAKYWDQHHALKDHTPSRLADPYLLLGAEKNTVQTEGAFNSHSIYCAPNTLFSNITHCYGFDVSTQVNSHCRGDSCLYSNGEVDGSIATFEGIAQSFPAPVHKPHLHPISTPPLNDNWLFSNIVAEEDFDGMVKSLECTYC